MICVIMIEAGIASTVKNKVQVRVVAPESNKNGENIAIYKAGSKDIEARMLTIKTIDFMVYLGLNFCKNRNFFNRISSKKKLQEISF